MLDPKLRALAIALTVSACGAEGSQLDGGTGMDAEVITGDPEILTFTASPDTLSPFGVTTLAWSARNSRLVDISVMDEGTLIATFEQQGSVSTNQLSRTTVFVLTASNGGKMVSRSLTVTVDWPEPKIDQFVVMPNPAFLNNLVTIQWLTRDADQSRFYVDDQLHSNIPLLPSGGQGFANLVIEKAETRFKLEVSNPDSTETREVTVTATDPPEITRFIVLPRVILGRTVTATVSWNARGVFGTELYVSGLRRIDFPGTLSGTVALDINGPSDFRLVGLGGAFQPEGYRQISPPVGEIEPNDDLGSARDLTYPGGVQGSFSTPTDRDFYYMFVSFNADLRVISSSQTGAGCAVDTKIILRDFNFNLLGMSSDGGAATGRGGECAVIDPAIHEYARDLQNGMYYLEVTSENGESGSYGMITDELF